MFFIAEIKPEDLGYLAGLMAAGKVTPVVDRTYPLDEVAEAIGYLEQGHARGKVIIVVPARGSGRVDGPRHPSGLIPALPMARPSAGTAYRGQVAQLVEQRIENPRVDGSIPSLATISNFLICMSFRASPADYRASILPRNRADPRTIGNCAIRGPRAGGGAGDLGTWEAGDLRGRSAGCPAGPDVAPEWARVRRAGAGHDDPHGHIARDPLAAGR